MFSCNQRKRRIMFLEESYNQALDKIEELAVAEGKNEMLVTKLKAEIEGYKKVNLEQEEVIEKQEVSLHTLVKNFKDEAESEGRLG